MRDLTETERSNRMYSGGYDLGEHGVFVGEAYAMPKLLKGDIPDVDDEWYRGHRAAVIAVAFGVSLRRQ